MEEKIINHTFDALTDLDKKYLIQMFVLDKFLNFIGYSLENLNLKEYKFKKTIEEMILCNLENNKKLNINSKIIEETNKIILKIAVNFGKIKELNFELDKIENSIDEKNSLIIGKKGRK